MSRLSCALSIAALLGPALALIQDDGRAARPANEPVDYDRDVRPILEARCFDCHGERKQRAGLRLDLRELALAGSFNGKNKVILPGDARASPLYQRITSTDPDERMPLDREPLGAAEIETLRAWLDAGAAWPAEAEVQAPSVGHWAYVAPRAPGLPPVKEASRVANEIDRFVLARLEQEGLAPAPEAPPGKLLRRLSLDLTGIPPTPAELDSFERDASPAAWEREVDRLLASPRYGERMAQWWLDLARYADTNGYEKDDRRTLWPWRDWVIAAFSDDMPFDRFTVEQLAGDLLPDATPAQKVATGFHRNTLVNQEGGIDPEEFRYAAVVDRANTTAQVWLGTTMACCQCHNHKYDPFSQRDYYSFYAFFDQTTDTGNTLEPVMSVPSAEQTLELARLEPRVGELERELQGPDDARDAAEREWIAATRSALPPPPSWTTLVPVELRAHNGSTLSLLEDGSVLASGPRPDTEVYELVFELAEMFGFQVLRLETLADPSLPQGGTSRSDNTNFVLTGIEIESAVLEPDPLGAGLVRHPRIAAARAQREQPGSPSAVRYALDDDPASGWIVEGAAPSEAVFALDCRWRGGVFSRVTVRLRCESRFAHHVLGRFRLSASDDDELGQSLRPPTLVWWSSAGPYAVASQAEGLEHEQAVGIQFGVDGAAGSGTLAAGDWQARPDWHDGQQHALEGEHSVWYLRRILEAWPGARRVALHIGADDALRVWLNGVLVHALDDYQGPPAADARRVELELPASYSQLVVKIVNGGGAGAFYSYFESLPEPPSEVAALLRRPESAWTKAERDRLRNHFRERVWPRGRQLAAELADLRAKLAALKTAIPTTLVLEERAEPRKTHVHAKGSFLAPTEEVLPDVPGVLPPLPDDAPKNRLGLARWIASPQNPLTARVIVNRIWERIFGHGIVATLDDFGTRGDAPTHPELLDWLALDLVESGWSLKALHKRIALSATYRQDSRASPAAWERDPENALHARGPRLRLEGETLRDAALAQGELLVEKLGGPSVFPPQPEGVWGVVYDDERWVQSEAGDQHRRGLYTFWRRSAPYATFMLFDAPSRELACTRRPRTNSPLQALALLNDPVYVECARALAARTLRVGGPNTSARLRYAFRLCTARWPEPEELAELEALVCSELADLGAAIDPAAVKVREHEPNPVELQAWTRVANILLNLDETLTKD